MFRTTELTRFLNPFLDSDESEWKQVELVLNSPWYLCNYTEENDSDEVRKNLLLINIENVINMTLKLGVIINELYIVTPAFINKSKNWNMDRVISIQKSNNHKTKNSNMVYKLIKDDMSVIVVDQVLDVDDSGYTFENFLSF